MAEKENEASFGSQIYGLILPIVRTWSDAYVRRSETFTTRLFAAAAGAFTVATPTALRIIGKEGSEKTTIGDFIVVFRDEPVWTATFSLVYFFAVFVSAIIAAHSLRRASMLVLYVVTTTLWAAMIGVISPS